MCSKLDSCVNKCYTIVVSHLYEYRGKQSCILDTQHRRDYIFKKKDLSINQCLTWCHNYVGCGAVDYQESPRLCWGTSWHKDFGRSLPANPERTSVVKCYTKKGVCNALYIKYCQPY